jgi:DNA-binding NarL/FixJ family response regulator
MGLKILLVDDHTLVRAGLRALVASLPGVDTVLEAGDGDEALKRLEQERPDIVLTDIQMPKLNGLEIVSRLHDSKSKTKVIVISMHANEEYVFRALKNGAAGYLLKDAPPDELERAIRAAMLGERYLDSRIAPKVNDYMRRAGLGQDPLDSLTPRQREVLQLVVQGYSNKDIAGTLEVSVKTVEAHRAQIMETLNLKDVPGLVRFAIRNGLISAEG